jgi:hypothetical protein
MNASWTTMKSIGGKKLIIFLIVIFLFLSNICNNLIINTEAESFNANIRVDDAGSNASTQHYTSIAVDNQGTIHVVWTDWRNDADKEHIIGGGIDGVNNADIYYTNSNDGGMTFGPNVKVNSGDGTSWQWVPDIAVDNGGKIHVVWEDWRDDADGEYIPFTGGIDGVNDSSIYYAQSLDGGQTFSSPLRIDDDSQLSVQGVPEIDIDGNENIHVIWIDVRETLGGDIYYTNSTNGGITFSKNKKVNDVSKGSDDPSLAVDENNVIYVVWIDNRNDTTTLDVYFSKSTDSGVSFSPNKKINDDDLPSAYQGTPSIAVGGGIIGVVWQDDRNPYGIYFANSTDGGDTFSVNKKIDDDPTGSDKSRPSIAINDNGHISITWMDKRNGDYDVYFANSTDGGDTFSQNQRVNDDTGTEYQWFPSLALRNRTIYITWQDNRKGNYDIYFSRSNYPPQMAIPISPPEGTIITDNTPTLEVIMVSDLDNDTIYYNFTISDQSDAESGTVYYSGWIPSASWKPPPLPNGIWYWHTYTSDMWNTTAPNWVWNFTINATLDIFYIQLYEGWNLISIPLIQLDTDLLDVLDSINGSYDAVQWYDASDTSDSWKHHHISKPLNLNDLETVDNKMGIWIHITEPGGVLFQCSGIIPIENQSISLKTGWNLVGYPSLSNRTRTLSLNNLTFDLEVDAIWTYNASNQKWEQIGEFDYFERGKGYWVHAKTDCVWDVPL